MTIDLHMHSNVSDGILPPAEVVRLCAGNGVKLMSLTDHDTMKGIEEARAEAERLGIAFVPGIEISTRWGQKSIHVAAYNLNPNTEAFKAFFKGVDKKRIERGERMGKLLAACGCKGAFEGAMALAVHPGSLSRTHFAQWLLDAGYVENYAQAFDKYLKPGKPGYVQIEWPEIRDAVRFVKSEGGTASLAHPGRYNLKEGWMIDELLTAFQGAGGEAIEVASGSQTRDDDALFAAKAKQYGFLASTGSDWHSPRSPRPTPGSQPQVPADLTPIWTKFGFPKDFCGQH
ncbi:PHP domain-containing protein [Sutterella wadsworthensis]|uniref:PHP domain-containing protein n=1 Tax=Sutterella wadsworthensis TaxID=40545 RepID=UPI003967044C